MNVEEDKKEEKDKGKKKEQSAPWKRIFADAKGYHLFIYLACFNCLIMGAAHPLLGYFLGDFVKALADTRDNKSGARNQLNNMFGYFIMMGVIVMIAGLFSMYLANLAGLN